jgi:hypothetical protein
MLTPAALLFGVAAAAAQPADKTGVELDLRIGAGGCPDCPLDETGVALGGRGSYRFDSGLAVGGTIESINSNSEGGCDPYGPYYYSDPDDCYRNELVLVFMGAELRWYPLQSQDTAFDPYFAVGATYGFGASRASGPDLAEYSGFVLLPRMGAMALVTEHLAIGGSFGRSFAFWYASCVDGDSLVGDGDFACADDYDESPDAWFTSADLEVRF